MSDQPVLRMPLHLLSMVLSCLDSMPSLASAIFSHSAFYAAFSEDRDRIVRQIITNQMSPEIVYYAVRTHAAGQWQPDRDGLGPIRGFLFEASHVDFRDIQARDARFTAPGPVDIRLAGRLSKTHAMVDHFTRAFLQDTLPFARQGLGLRRGADYRASEDEEFRIHRAMYRFQLYCNLFRYPWTKGQGHDIEVALFTHFFYNFSSWVNEQLACVLDYFDRVLSVAYDEVAAHDVQWGFESVDWITPCSSNPHKQTYLFRGLDFLYKLHRAETYDERRGLLQSPDIVPTHTKHSLYGHLMNGSMLVDLEEWRWWWTGLPEWINSGDHESITKWWVYNGPDVYGSGPFRMWHASHKNHWRFVSWPYETHAWFRRCGYVMWDQPDPPLSDEELDAQVEEARKLSLLEHFRRIDRDRKREMKRSWRERAVIYRRGGRGYWSEGDLSRVVWTEGGPG